MATPSPKPLQLGISMSDGTVYAGSSPETGKAMYAMPADATVTYTFNEAQEYAQSLNAWREHGHDDWRVPTKNELNVLFNNRAAIRGFDVGDYWSASLLAWGAAWGQRFSDGLQGSDDKRGHSSVRCVRTDPLRPGEVTRRAPDAGAAKRSRRR